MARVESEVAAPKGGIIQWIDDRFPMTKLVKEHLTEYYASKNFNFWYVFGVIAMLALVMQIITGLFLTMRTRWTGLDEDQTDVSPFTSPLRD